MSRSPWIPLPNQPIHSSVIEAMHIHAVRPGTPDDARVDLRIPPDFLLFRLTLDAPSDYPGYTWELVGTAARPDPRG